jgi:hypothetical protein
MASNGYVHCTLKPANFIWEHLIWEYLLLRQEPTCLIQVWTRVSWPATEQKFQPELEVILFDNL